MTHRGKLIAFCLAGLILAGSYFWFDLGSWLNFAWLSQSREALEARYVSNPLTLILIYSAIYVFCTALNLPGAVLLGLLAGAVFGVFTGTLVVSFASSLGALCSFFLSRYFLSGFLRSRFAAAFAKIDAGVETEGAYYLFFLRLAPVFPFFLVNMLMGLTKMRAGVYYLVSQLGMLPGTVLYLNAGRELGRISSLPDVFSPSLLVSFALLGLFPLAAKRLIGLIRAKRRGEV